MLTMSSEISQDELRQVVERAQDGSLEAYHTLYSLYGKPVYHFIWRLIGKPEEADDLTQETFMKVYAEIGNLRNPGQFKYWLFRIARNEVYQRLRRRKTRKAETSLDTEEISYYDFLPDESLGTDPEGSLLSEELVAVINQALASLRPKYRDVFVLAVYEKMSYEEIAQVVGRSLLSVKTDIYRARLAVKEVLTDYLSRKK